MYQKRITKRLAYASQGTAGTKRQIYVEGKIHSQSVQLRNTPSDPNYKRFWPFF
jgi:hypothetical protein